MILMMAGFNFISSSVQNSDKKISASASDGYNYDPFAALNLFESGELEWKKTFSPTIPNYGVSYRLLCMWSNANEKWNRPTNKKMFWNKHKRYFKSNKFIFEMRLLEEWLLRAKIQRFHFKVNLNEQMQRTKFAAF